MSNAAPKRKPPETIVDLSPAFTLPAEEITADAPVDGRLPAFVRGALVQNGPGTFAVGRTSYRHWLDGDGYVSRLTLQDGRARYEGRFVETPKRRAEQAAGSPLFRAFGSALGENRLGAAAAIESPANVSVLSHAGRLFALGEQAEPYELDPRTLRFSAARRFAERDTGWSPVAAHSRVDPRTQELFLFGLRYLPRHANGESPDATSATLDCYRLDRKQRLIYREANTLDRPHYVHDFAISGAYLVFHLAPYYFDLRKFSVGKKSVLDSLRWEPEQPAFLLLCSRRTGRAHCRVPVPVGFCIHLVNAFEDGAETVVDIVEFERPFYDELLLPVAYGDVPRGRPVRYRIDANRGAIVDRVELSYDRGPDFPHVGTSRIGSSTDRFWALGVSRTGTAGPKFYDELVELDWESGSHRAFRAPAGSVLCGEPVLVCDPSSAAAVVICQSFSPTDASFRYLVLDAARPEAGPLATIAVPGRGRLALHSAFVPLLD